MLPQSNSNTSSVPPADRFTEHSDRDEIRRAADILEVVQDHLKLRKAGRQYVGLCPFHREKTPSFYVSATKQVYRCHGCGAGGDVLSFVMNVEHIGFQAALGLLADRYGIRINDKPLTTAEKLAYSTAKQARDEERELLEHFRLVEFVPVERAAIEFAKRCEVDPGYRGWLQADMAQAYACCGVIVAALAIAQERDGGFPATAEAEA